MIPAGRLPTGLATLAVPGGLLATHPRQLDWCRRAGLEGPDGWRRLLDDASAAVAGRGATARVELDGGVVGVAKQLRRGGMLAALWRDRFPGARRLLDNLYVPVEAARRGVATPQPLAMLLLEGPPKLYRGWLVVERVAGARDLAARFAASPPPTTEELSAVMRTVRRMHDLGLEHRDLNLGNLLLRRNAEGHPEGFVIDLDGARLGREALTFRRRQRALRRLERSYVKRFGAGAEAPDWFALYAANDPELLRRLERGRPVGRLWLLLHRIGWSR